MQNQQFAFCRQFAINIHLIVYLVRAPEKKSTLKDGGLMSLFKRQGSYPLCIALLSCSRWIGNPINHSSTTVSVSQSCLSAHVFKHMRFSESN